MPKALICFAAFSSVTIAAFLGLSSNASAESVWSGLTFTFTKEDFSNPVDAANQDQITDDVWITRNAFGQGLLNAATECDFTGCAYTHNSSPEGTLWATAALAANSGQTIAASNWQNLVFTDWEAAYQNSVGSNILNPNYRDAVVHIVADNIYLDLRFLGWSQRGGGGFSYIRATASTPPPTTGDYNVNGVIDAADYVVWRNTNGQTGITPGTGADGNANGSIESGDYDFWRAHFGNTLGSGALSQSGAVPEPSSLLIIAGLLSCGIMWRGFAVRGR
jgi:PEP-CTERM motif-containing protein